MRHANGCPLPAGVRFFIWPKYVLSVDGIEVELSRYRAEILLFLMSRPETRFSTREIARAIYWHRNDGGAWATGDIIPTQVFHLVRSCRDAGIELRLKKPGSYQGYAFMGIGLTAAGAKEAEYRAAATAGTELPARIEPLPRDAMAKAKKAIRVARRIAKDEAAVKPPRKRRKHRAILRHPDRFGDSDGWMFPAHYERQHHRAEEKDDAD